MPLPILLVPMALKGTAVVAGVAGVGVTTNGVKKRKEANDTMESIESHHAKNMAKFESENEKTTQAMDKLGKLELDILHSFSEFSDVFEKIKNRLTFAAYTKNGVTLQRYDGEKIKEVSVGAATLGVGLLVGGIICNFTGGKLSDKADEAWVQMRGAERKINTICKYLGDLRSTADRYYTTLSQVNTVYQNHLMSLKILTRFGHADWNFFTLEEKRRTENTVLLVGLLYDMCKVELVLKSERENSMNTINKTAVETAINSANAVLADKF